MLLTQKLETKFLLEIQVLRAPQYPKIFCIVIAKYKVKCGRRTSGNNWNILEH